MCNPSADKNNWRQICQIALLETDKNLVVGRVAEARYAISLRQAEGAMLLDERLAIEDALLSLEEIAPRRFL